MEQCTRCPHPQAAHTQHGCRFGGCHCDVSRFANERVPAVAPVLVPEDHDGTPVAIIAVAAFVSGLIGLAIGWNL